MTINLKKLEERTHTITFEYGDQAMEIEYRPSAISKRAYFDELKSIEDIDDSLCMQMKTAIVHWGLVDEAGEELAPSIELIRAVERPFWLAIVEAINEDLQRRHSEKKASKGT